MARSGRPLKVDPIVDRLFLDIEKGNDDTVIAVLQEKGIDCFDRYRRTVLINSACYGNTQLLQWCLEHGADVNFQDVSGMSALHFAAQEGKVNAAHILVSHNAKINLQDNYGKSPLLTALLNWKNGENFEMV